jgi:hypothetical protein
MNFNEIYDLVKSAENFEDLKEKLKGVDIDTKEIGAPFTTVAGALASENPDNNERVEWLRLLGANVNNIALGYALRGDVGKVEEYKTTHNALERDIIIGYVIGGHKAEAEKHAEKSNPNHKKNLDYLAYAYAIAGVDDQVIKYRELGADVKLIAKGYALNGDLSMVRSYYADYPTSKDSIVEGYARAGDLFKAVRFAKGDIIPVFIGCIRAGNEEALQSYLKTDLKYAHGIAYAYAYERKDEKVEEYRTQYNASSKMIAQGYEAAGNTAKVKEYDMSALLKSYIEQRTEKRDKSEKTKEYLHPHLPGFFQKSFTKKKEAVEKLMSALDGNAEDGADLTKHLATLRNGTLGKELRAFIKAGKADELVGDKKVTSVTEFVKALEKQCKAAEVKPTTPPS